MAGNQNDYLDKTFIRQSDFCGELGSEFSGGVNPGPEITEEYKNIILKLNSFHLLKDWKDANINPNEIAPTMLLHGAYDDCVPVEQSLDLCLALGSYNNYGEIPLKTGGNCLPGEPCSQNGYSLTGKCGDRHIIEYHQYLTHDPAKCGPGISADTCSQAENAVKISMDRALNWLEK